ncbi:MAG: glycosyltransferase family 9 protein [Ignavibacteria bacterium]|nr:glycosyltransferase family 9 protein [Ignavibacteria bacterium]MCU7517352.1 glycosyltransferase family 9 protein [Ignavibacteria bacterium]
MSTGEAENILIIRLSSLGDILLTTPLLRSLKNLYPGKKIDFLVRSEYAGVLKFNPYVSEVLLYNRDPNEGLLERLKTKSYGMIVDLQNNLRSRKIVKTFKDIPVYRFNKRSFDKFLLVKFKVNRLSDAPQIPVRYASSIPGFNLDDKGLDLFLPENAEEFNAPKVERQDNLIAFCPGSRHFTKMWPLEYFAALGRLLEKKGFKIVLLGGRSDREVCQRLSEKIPSSVDLSNEDELFFMAALMKKCRLVVCNDSGLMHLSCAAGVPVLAIFGSTVKEFGFTPYKNKNLILENNSLSCRPCSHIGRDKCPLGHFKCMLELTPEMVFDNVKRMLDLS